MLINNPVIRSAIENFKGTIPQIPDYTVEFISEEYKGEMTYEEKVLLAFSYNIDDQLLELIAGALGKKKENLSSSDKFAIPKILENNTELRTQINDLQVEQKLYTAAAMESIETRIRFNSAGKLMIFLFSGYKIIVGEPKNKIPNNSGIVFPGMKL